VLDSRVQLPAFSTCVHTPHVPTNFAVLLWRGINLPAVIAAVCAQALTAFLVSGLPSSLDLQISPGFLHARLFHVSLGCIRVDSRALLSAQSGTLTTVETTFMSPLLRCHQNPVQALSPCSAGLPANRSRLSHTSSSSCRLRCRQSRGN
jgi:hypothetical protein